MRPVILFWFCIMFLSSCSTSITRYQNNLPTLDVEQFFDGQLSAHGVVKNRGGEVIRFFNASILATTQDNGTILLDENFVFNDGEKQQRQWYLKPTDSNQYLASANDVVGEHIMQVAGNALFMKYVLTINVKGSTLNVNVDDKMFLVNSNTIINESVLYKFGFKVGSVQLVIVKQ